MIKKNVVLDQKLGSLVAFFYMTMFTFILMDDYISNVLKIPLLGKAASMAVFFLSIILFFIYKKHEINKKLLLTFTYFAIYIVSIFLLNSVFANYRYFYLPSFLYETYKLATPFILLTMLVFDDILTKKIIVLMLHLFFIFIAVNLFVIVLQHLFGASIVKYIGMQLTFQFRNNRPTGITSSANIIGDVAVFIFAMFLILKEKIKTLQLEKYTYIIKAGVWLSAMTIILSTSKHALLIFLVFFIVRSKLNLKKASIFVVVLFLVIVLMFTFDIMDIRKKFEMYYYFITNFNSLDTAKVEIRLKSVFNGVKIMSHHFPFGTGLGTWGDFSQSFNSNAHFWGLRNKMSDTYIIHLMVEHGIFLLFYMGIIVITLFRKNIYAQYLLIAIFLMSFFTMGFSSSTFPYVFSFCIVLLEYIDKVEHKLNNKSSYSLQESVESD